MSLPTFLSIDRQIGEMKRQKHWWEKLLSQDITTIRTKLTKLILVNVLRIRLKRLTILGLIYFMTFSYTFPKIKVDLPLQHLFFGLLQRTVWPVNPRSQTTHAGAPNQTCCCARRNMHIPCSRTVLYDGLIRNSKKWLSSHEGNWRKHQTTTKSKTGQYWKVSSST